MRFGGLRVLVGSKARVWSLVWPEDLKCRCQVLFRGSTVRLWSLAWPKYPWCRCLV